MKLKPQDLEDITRRMRATTSLREGAGRARITVHLGTCGIAAGAREILDAFHALVTEKNAETPAATPEESKEKSIILTTSGCAGLCAREPMVTVEIKGQTPVKYVDLTAEKAKRIFLEHVVNDRIVTEYALVQGSERIS
jgi:NADP-reducing hydrogenase subunit HndB